MRLSRIAIAAALALVICCCRRTEFRTASGAAWATTYHITYCADSDLSDSVVAEMRRVELSLSMFDPQSTISKINRGQSCEVDSMFAEVFRTAKQVHSLSHGAFDPTVAPLVNLWGFGRKGRNTPTPDSITVAHTLNRVGFDKCRLEGSHLLRENDSTELDFSAIAKGYGVDCVARMLRRNGAKDYMVEIGGEVVAAGLNPRRKPWRIQIDAPSSAAPGDSALRVIELTDQAVATSGNYRNYRRTADGSTFGHTINPTTGYPVATTTLSATIIAPTCILADALATASMALPADSIAAMISKIPNTQAIIVVASPEGSYEVNTFD